MTTQEARPRRASTEALFDLLGDIPWWGVIVAIVGVILSFIFGGYHVIGGLLPGISWFAMGALKGSTMVAMQDKLMESKALYENLRDDGMLVFRSA